MPLSLKLPQGKLRISQLASDYYYDDYEEVSYEDYNTQKRSLDYHRKSAFDLIENALDR